MAISPTNFNIYEVLEPMKCPLTGHVDNNVGILIDIGDKDDLSADISGSQLDSIKKSEFDLVDLYQNIYVTPQHVKKPQEWAALDIDFNESINKVQATEKIAKHQNGLKPLKDSDIVELLYRSDNNEKDDLGKSNDKGIFNQNILHSYDIPKVLKVPTLYSSTNKTGFQMTSKNGSASNNLPRNILDTNRLTNFTADLHNDIFEKDLKTKKMIESTFIRNSVGTQNPGISKMRESTFIQFSVETQNPGISKMSLNKPPIIENFETLQTVKLDKKVYARQRLIKCEREKILYTKGPGLYEKSVVLPQIMNRLAVRKQAMEDKLTRRLILDSGKQNPENTCQCSHKMALNSNTEAAVKENLKKANILPKNLSKQTFNTVSTTQREAQSPSSGVNHSLDTGVKLNATVAMEDCNRERLLAHRVRSAFERFIHTGSYY